MAALLAAASGAPASGTTFTVNVNGDTPDANPGNGACADTNFHCTLRAAIQESNALAGTDTINFALGPLNSTIAPDPELPQITDRVVIDGTPPGSGYVEPDIDGSGVLTYGLMVSHGGAGSTIKHLIVTDCDGPGGGIALRGDGVLVQGNVLNNTTNAGITIEGTDASHTISGAHIVGNLIGTSSDGDAKVPNGYGIRLSYATNNLIGGTVAGSGNLISGNSLYGIGFLGPDSSGNVVVGNTIGTNLGGTAALSNGGAGVLIEGDSSSNTIGPENLISGNAVGVSIAAPASGNAVVGNYVGLDSSGTSALPNQQGGIAISGAPDTTIGGTSSADRNVISGNSSFGISVTAGAMGTIAEGNYIGTDATGGSAIPNAGGGVKVDASVQLGGTAVGAGNVISGNSSLGVDVTANGTGSSVRGNLIGTDASGASAVGNANGGIFVGAPIQIGGSGVGAGNLISGNVEDAVTLAADGIQVTGNKIGTNLAGTAPLANQGYGIFSQASTPTISDNLVSGNTGTGIWEDSGNGATISGNTVGTNASGTAAIPNGVNGIQLSASGGDTISGNLVSGNTQNGVYLLAPTGGQAADTIEGNKIGTDASGTLAVANGNDGIRIDGVPGTQIGGTTAAVRNIVSGNTHAGIEVDSPATGTTIQGNYVGTDMAGTSALGNGGNGIDVFSGPTTIGSTDSGAGNVISANFNGVNLRPGSSQASIQGNFIGTNNAGSAALGNNVEGVKIDHATQNTIGGTTAAARNVISGNGDGVRVSGDGIATAMQNVVEGNYIGTDVTGTIALGNVNNGIFLDNALGNTFGTPSHGNVISGNQANGVRLLDTGAKQNLVQGNNIGTNAAGTGKLANSQNGVLIDRAPGNTIGGSTAGSGNLISGNGADGVALTGSTATGNTVRGNLIGTAVGGTGALGNHLNGVRLINGASSNVIGTTNKIAFNGARGVFIGTAIRDRITGNSIFSNVALGIDLVPAGPTPNDPAPDADTGANKLQNYPVLTSAQHGIGSITITGTLTSAFSSTFLLQFFASPTCDGSGFGEGARYLGAANTTTNGSGVAAFNVTLPAAVSAGSAITATATDALGNTSEFSGCKLAS